MHWLLFMVTLMMIVMSECDRDRFNYNTFLWRRVIKDYFTMDWPIEDDSTVLYSRNFKPRHYFAFAACKSDSHCNITLAFTNSSSTVQTCTVYIKDVLPGGIIGLSSLHMPIYDPDRIAMVWWQEIDGLYGFFVNAILMKNCDLLWNTPISSMNNNPIPPRVVLYEEPYFSTITTESDNRRLVMTFSSFGGWLSYNGFIRANHLWIGEEQPIQIENTRGFFFIGTNEEPEWKVSVMYANTSDGWSWERNEIEYLKDSTHTNVKSSGTYNKYGLCWRIEKDYRVNCAQFGMDGGSGLRKSVEYPIDWFAVHNLKWGMLLVTGQCFNERNCSQFQVKRLLDFKPDSEILEIDSLNIECSEAPLNLTVDVVEYDEGKLICFNFVCLKDDVGRVGRILQYRRYCINSSYLNYCYPYTLAACYYDIIKYQ